MDKPLHVRVAEALGWTEARCLGNRDSWDALAPLGPPHGYRDGQPYWLHLGRVSQRVPHYDTDWSATGPLIERFKVDVWYRPGGVFGDAEWGAVSDDQADTGAMAGATPLIAVCNLILALHAAGKLHLPPPDDGALRPAALTGSGVK